MTSRYIKTYLATSFEKSSSKSKNGLELVLSLFIPQTNSGYEKNLHCVKAWLIEFDEHGRPAREIGVNENDQVILAGPNEENYGYWLDTNMTISDFDGEPVSKELFEQLWRENMRN